MATILQTRFFRNHGFSSIIANNSYMISSQVCLLYILSIIKVWLRYNSVGYRFIQTNIKIGEIDVEYFSGPYTLEVHYIVKRLTVVSQYSSNELHT